MTLPRYALHSFTHLDMHVKKGEEVDLHHPLVELRPDLFTTEAPEKPKRKPKPTDHLTSAEVAEVFDNPETEAPTEAPEPEEP